MRCSRGLRAERGVGRVRAVDPVLVEAEDRVLQELKEHLDDARLHVVAAPGAGKTVLGLEVIRSGETREGATRFREGAGRHGDFQDI